MKSNWLIAAEPAAYENIISVLNQKSITILNRMDEISVLLIEATSAAIEPLKNVEGVLGIEPEGTVTVQ
jgi:hypothetical protein